MTSTQTWSIVLYSVLSTGMTRAISTPSERSAIHVLSNLSKKPWPRCERRIPGFIHRTLSTIPAFGVCRSMTSSNSLTHARTRYHHVIRHKELVKELLQRPAVKAEYDAQRDEFALLDELLKARHRAGLTQAEVAARMGTKTPAVARLESGGGSQRHSPSVATLRKYARAVGCRLEIRLRRGPV
jgi:DNA-binding XRE family transcriptional regulator